MQYWGYYTLTDSGLRELHRLSLGYPEIPEIRKSFLMQLVFGGSFTKSELASLFERYSSEVKGFMRIGEHPTVLRV